MIQQDHSLRRKVTLAMFTAISATLLLAAIGLGVYEYRVSELRLKANLEGLAQITLVQVTAAVDLGYPETATDALERLGSSPLVNAAAAYARGPGSDRAAFARFVRAGQTAHFRAAGREDGYFVEGEGALLVTTLVRDGVPVVTLEIEGDLASTRREAYQSLKLLGVVIVLLLVVGAALSRWLQNAITRPVLQLVGTARRVHETGDFGLRAAVTTSDEIGQLARQFNDMLAGIGERDRAIAANHALQQAILAGAGVAVVGCGPDGVVRAFNPAAEKLLGYTADEVIGKASPVLWHDPTEVLARAEELSLRLRRTVRPGFETFVAAIPLGRVEEQEWTYVRKDGRRVPVSLVTSELRGPTGELTGYVGLATDLTDRRRRERALQSFSQLTGAVTGQEFFTATVRHLAEELGVRYAFIVEVALGAGGEPTGRTLAAWADGPADNLTYRLPGTPCENVAAQGLCHIPDRVAELFPTDKMLVDMAARSYVGVPIRDHTGQTLGLVAILDDKPMAEAEAASLLLVLSATRAAAEIQRLHNEQQITQLNADLEARVHERTFELGKRVAEVERLNGEQFLLMRDLRGSQQSADRSAARLQEVNAHLLAANQELEAFSYSVSHDLRAPLRNITGFLELLSKRTAGRLDAESDRFISVVTTQATRMGMLIDDLLTFSRIGRTEMNLQTVDLAPLVAEVREELKSEIVDRTVDWQIGELPLVRGDPVLLRQVISNLIGNAAKFTRNRPAACIEIGASAAGRGERLVTIFVRDNGAGFNPKYLDKLFGVFQRLHNARDFEGTGIGLANVKRIVTRHGGRVWAEGQVDRGATFYFTLSIANP